MSDSVSVVMPTSHRHALLHNALNSLFAQTTPPREIVVAAFSGDTESIDEVNACSAEARDAGIALKLEVTTEDSMIARQNAVIRNASADIIAFMDDDAAARPDWLERLLTHYRDPKVGAVGGRDVVWLNGSEYSTHARRVGQISWYGRLYGNHHNIAPQQEVAFLKGCNMSYRRELLTELDTRLQGPVAYGYEIDLGLKVRARGFKMIYDPLAAVDHYPASDMHADAIGVARVVNHNQTYVLLSRLPFFRRLAFFIYTALIGDLNTAGAIRIPWLRWGKHWTWQAIGAHLIGKRDGVRSYRAARQSHVRAD